MSSNVYQWLPHLKSSIPESAKGYTTGMYSIALEGWRRGLSLKFINSFRTKSNTVFELSDDNKTHRFTASRGDLVSQEAMEICRNKAKTKEYLIRENVPTPLGKDFPEGTKVKDIEQYAKELGYPLVVKPLDGTGGKGVIAGIIDEKELNRALTYVRDKLGYKHIIVEQYFSGEDYRIYVVGDKVVAVTKRIPANVVGDGKTSIRELIRMKNNDRKKSPILGSSLIKIDQELNDMLSRQNLSLDSIAPKGMQVFLKSKNNISAGGDPVDITDEISNEIKNIAIAGRRAIPGLPHGAIDLMVDVKRNKAVIIEINTQASIRTHLFPMAGIARDVPAKIIDYYFPNTKQHDDCPLYFDFGPIWEQFRKRTAEEISIPNIPSGNIKLTRFIVSGQVRRVRYASWVRRQARDLGIHGYVRHMSNHTVSIVVCGNEDSINKFRNIIIKDTPMRINAARIEEKARTTPVEVGFKIYNASMDRPLKDGYTPVRLKDPMRSKIRKSKKNRRSSKEKRTIDYKKEYEKIINSTSWRITKPIRLLGKIIKRK